MEDSRGAYRNFVGKPDEKRTLGKPMSGWKDNIKIRLQDMGWRA